MQDTHHLINIIRGRNYKKRASNGHFPPVTSLDDKGCPEAKDGADNVMLVGRALEQFLVLEADEAEPSPAPAPPQGRGSQTPSALPWPLGNC